ncbi:unnamed protein product, partial [Allacma fusca]
MISSDVAIALAEDSIHAKSTSEEV